MIAGICSRELFGSRHVAAALVVFALAGSAQAAPITAPGDLSFGDEYRLVFVSQDRRDLGTTDLSVYNAWLTSEADAVPELAALNTTWTMIGSSPTVDARDNTDTNPTSAAGVPIYNLAGLRVANNNADLWDGSIQNPININETGTANTAFTHVWTGSTTSGVTFLSFGVGASQTSQGTYMDTGGTWIQNFITSSTGIGQVRFLYGISGPLVAVPEPASLGLVVIAGLGLFGVAGRRR